MEPPESDSQILQTFMRDREGGGQKSGVLFQELLPKMESALNETGFYVWVDADDRVGHLATYRMQLDQQAEFILRKSIFGERTGSLILTGNYVVDGHEVRVDINQEAGSSMLSHMVFIDGKLVASRADPLSEIMAASLQLAEDVSSIDDTSRFDDAQKVSTEPYVLAMLRDFAQSAPDDRKIQEMFEKMQRPGRIVEWAKDS